MYYEVMPAKRYGREGVLTYESDDSLLLGQIVEIPLGRGKCVGIITKKVAQPDFACKKILKVFYSKPLPKHLVRVAEFIAEYYKAPLSSAVGLILPNGVEKQRRKKKTEQMFGTEQMPEIALNQAQKNALESLQTAPGATKLLCGVTGSGKTNIYLKRAHSALSGQKSVILLVPEIALTGQLVRVFREFFGKKVVMIHSKQTEAERHLIFEEVLNAEEPLVVIGPRSALFAPLKDLGLIIIDEEHRFGVKHKETLKKARMTVDSLSMTATPIPRTLHMSLANIRDMSVINTPPRQRIPVETYVMEFNEEVLINAVNKELDRGGQIFFVYNRVTTILEMKKYLNRICPRARVVISHAQMPEEHLENIIHDFINYEYDILLTTTIVESGIDIPRANTIIIDRADRFGLAQLYQLRGRVGRADIQAYAYMFYNADGTVTEDAMKRLKVISQYTDLGSGFKVAMKDLEIRGAGNIFGAEQSGNILAVGFHLYCKLLNDAIAELSRDPNYKEEKLLVEKEVAVNLKYQGYIPNSYITDARQKIECYKRIAGIVHQDEIDEIRQTMTDRFGPIPPQVEELLYIADIRLVCKRYNITEITEKTDSIQIIFDTFDNVDINSLMNVIAKSAGRVYINNAKANSIFVKQYIFDEWTLKQKWDFVKDLLGKVIREKGKR